MPEFIPLSEQARKVLRAMALGEERTAGNAGFPSVLADLAAKALIVPGNRDQAPYLTPLGRIHACAVLTGRRVETVTEADLQDRPADPGHAWGPRYAITGRRVCSACGAHEGLRGGERPCDP